MRSLILTAAALLLACPAASQTAARTAGYAGQHTRDIKALSAQEVADLLAGRGMGLAHAAELNHHPGPMHVLDLGDELGLTAEQHAAVRRSFERMAALARPLGAELVRREQALDDAFKRHAVTPADLAEHTASIGAVQGRLRAVHLATHLETRAVLTAGQVARYDELRGYTGDAAPGAGASGAAGGGGEHGGGHGGHRGGHPR